MKIILEIETRDGHSLAEAKLLLETLTGEAPIVVTVPEKTVEDKTPKKNTKPKPAVEKAVEKPVEKVEESTISLADLKDSAKNAVGRTDRDKVKVVINEFAEKLAEVKESDFGKLYKKLQELS